MTAVPADLVYLATRVHARYGQRAQELRAETLVQPRTPEAFWRAVYPDTAPAGTGALQRRLFLEWWAELEGLARGVDAGQARLLRALAGAVELEDQKVLARGAAAGKPADTLAAELLRPAAAPTRRRAAAAALAQPAPSPSSRGADTGDRAGDTGDRAGDTGDRAGDTGDRAGDAGDHPAAPPRPFALETTLDERHARRLVAALRGLGARDRRQVAALVRQEVDHFHLLLVARGRFTHRIAPDALLSWHVAGAAIGRDRLHAMLAAPDLGAAAALAVGLAIDALPAPAPLDARALLLAAWRRFLRLARQTFRAGGTRFPALVGYAGLRRVEVMDLTTLSEGVRLHEGAAALLARLLRPTAEGLRA